MLKFTVKFIIDYLNIEINYCKNCYQMFFINNLTVIYTVSISFLWAFANYCLYMYLPERPFMLKPF